MIENTPQATQQDNVFNPTYTLWFWCAHCWDRQDQIFIRDDDIFEIYQCCGCGKENKKAVR